jgi:hypothetical protein
VTPSRELGEIQLESSWSLAESQGKNYNSIVSIPLNSVVSIPSGEAISNEADMEETFNAVFGV